MEQTKYKIQGRGNSGDWDESYVGNSDEANTFDNEDAAAQTIPHLARLFECEPGEFRVVER